MNGYIVLRSPVRHCELNPIELIWAQIKRYVSSRNVTFKFKDVQQLTYEAIEQVSQEKWQKCTNHVKKPKRK